MRWKEVLDAITRNNRFQEIEIEAATPLKRKSRLGSICNRSLLRQRRKDRLPSCCLVLW
jgi:hypothetical protein